MRPFSLRSATALVALSLLASTASAQKTRPPAAPAPPAETEPPQEPPPPSPPDHGPDITAIRARLDQLEQELAAGKQRADAEAAARAEAEGKAAEEKAAAAKLVRPPGKGIHLGAGVVLSGYVQAQYENSRLSEDAVDQAGALLNLDRFSVRRSRLKMAGDWEWAALVFEVNGATNRGYNLNVRRAEAALHTKDPVTGKPIVELALGVIDQPFGFELVQSSRDRYFLERAFGIRSLFVGPADVGARLSGNYRFLNWAVALMNGEPQGEETGFPAVDPTGNKDVLVKVGFTARVTDTLTLAGGVSALKGQGFRPGAPATKARVDWRDFNENGSIDNGELSPVPAVAATPSFKYDRWATGVDLRLDWKNPLGNLFLAGELVLAENLDRWLFRPDPLLNNRDSRELAWYVGGVQKIGDHFFAGLRYDVYDPDSDVFDSRGGKLIPSDQTISTWSPVIGYELPDRARLSVEYEVVSDHLARDEKGVPADLDNDLLTVRLQVQL